MDCFKFDFCKMKWDHAEDVIDKYCKQNEGTVKAIGICWGKKEKKTMCDECFCKFGMPFDDKTKKQWPIPECATKKEHQERIEKKKKTGKGCAPCDVEEVKRDGGNAIQECDKFNSLSVGFSCPVVIPDGAVQILKDEVAIPLPEMDTIESSQSWNFSESLPPGEYEVLIDLTATVSAETLLPVCAADEQGNPDILPITQVVALPGDIDTDMDVGFDDAMSFLGYVFNPVPPTEANWSEGDFNNDGETTLFSDCLLYTSPSPRDLSTSRMPSSA